MVKDETANDEVRLFLAGDVMTGRGIDQILAHPGNPVIHERYVTSAIDYVRFAEQRSGAIARPVTGAYVWGDLLAELDRRRPNLHFVNLETAITARGCPAAKGINYRMHPANIDVLAAAGIQACSLANNHVLDWGREGLFDTVASLRAAGIGAVGAGRDHEEATSPIVLHATQTARAVILGLCFKSSGVPADWAARDGKAGVNLVQEPASAAVRRIASTIAAHKRDRDIALVSIHWGGNWGYEVDEQNRAFAHALIDEAGVDIVHGHSSHHAKPLEVYRGKLILYGCGDLINDYEGIATPEQFGQLACAFFVRLNARDGMLVGLDLLPFVSRRLRLQRADETEARWLADRLTAEGRNFGTRLIYAGDRDLRLIWQN